MKHFILYLLAGFLIFGILGSFASPVADSTGAPIERGTASAAFAIASVTNDADQKSAAAGIQIGVVMGPEETMSGIRFRSALKQICSEQDRYTLHLCEFFGSVKTQLQMFEKLLNEGCSVLFVELAAAEDAQIFIDQAEGSGAAIVFMGAEPDAELLKTGRYYYLGFSNADLLREVAQNLTNAWQNNRTLLDYFEDDSLACAFLSDEDYAENGKAESFTTALKVRNIESETVKASITSYYNFDLYKEIDRIWVAKAELLICTSSAYARQALDYLNDPTEFAHNRIQLVVLVADEETRRMVEDGEILLAVGMDGKQLGKTAAVLAGLLADGEEPTEETLGVSVRSGRMLYLPNTVVRSPRLDEIAVAPEEEGRE